MIDKVIFDVFCVSTFKRMVTRLSRLLTITVAVCAVVYVLLLRSTVDTSKFENGWRPASYSIHPNMTLDPRPLQKSRLIGNRIPDMLLHLENTSSFMISDSYARLVANPVPHQSFTLTQWDRQEDYTGHDDTHQCLYSTCRIVTNKSVNTDGYIFNLRGGNTWPPLPNLTEKISILLMTESPVNTFGFARAQTELPFDVSLTYRWDSDALFVYGIAQLRAEPLPFLPDFAVNKSKGAFWAVSNWSGRRFNVYRELSRLIEIDIIGAMSWMNGFKRSFYWSNVCEKENNEYGDCLNDKNIRVIDNCETRQGAYFKCMGDFANDYWFYLAFENSECDQYISEKPWHALSLGSVPIVLGGLSPAEYSEVLPPRSFIHVDDFESTEELAEYLKYLMRNPHAYNEYHEWRRFYEPFQPSLTGNYSKWCHLCDVVAQKKYNNDFYRQTVGDWWFGKNGNSTCRPVVPTRNF